MNTRFLLFAALAAGTLSARGQDHFNIAWSTISGGGGPASGGAGFSIEAAIGQIAAGDPDGGQQTGFSINGGYWSFTLEPPLDLNFRLQLNGGLINLWWDADGRPVFLEGSYDLQLWEPVGPQPAVSPYQDRAASRRYYRLKRAPD